MIPEALIFDFDGTIIDTETAEFVSVGDAFAEHGLEFTLEEFRTMIGRTDHTPWYVLLQERGAKIDDLDDLLARRRAHHLEIIDATELRAGVLDALGRAERAGTPVAVASSSPQSWIDRHLAVRGLTDRFPVIATGDMVPQAKPWPDVFLLAAEKLGVAPETCLVIEDSHNGLVAAKAAGMRCVVVPNDMTVGLDFTTADWLYDSLTDFPWETVGL